MFDITLRLEYDQQSDTDSAPSGWYLPSATPSAWLTALEASPLVAAGVGTHSPIKPAAIQFFLAPSSNTNATTAGLIGLGAGPLACPAGAIPLFRKPTSSGQAEVWIPSQSRISPGVNGPALKELLGMLEQGRFVWLPPGEGIEPRFVCLEANDEVDLSVLLRPARDEHLLDADDGMSGWEVPPAATVLPASLTNVLLDTRLVSQLPLGNQEDAIGQQADQLLDIDDNGNVQGGGIQAATSRWFRRSFEKLAGLLGKLARRPAPHAKPAVRRPAQSTAAAANPAARQAPSPVKKRGLGSFLVSKFAGALESQRDKQLEKLLNLLARDPDKALKYALPLGESGLPRGISEGGSDLVQHGTDFSLSGLFGSHTSQVWHASKEMQHRLREAYEAQVRREVAAGRYRRAAYIYAHLIGDYHWAAAVLEKGKFFREAAALYERLARRRDQARCLHLCGQTNQAAEIYESIGDYEEAARLWAGITQHDKARAAYQKAYEQLLKSKRILEAARILKLYLNQPNEAQELLWSQWPGGSQPVECVTTAFTSLAQEDRVEEAHERFEQIICLAQDAHQTMLAELCVDIPNRFPTLGLRQRAEDQCRLSIATKLQWVSPSQFEQRMRILRRLHPADALLHRDIRRFEKLQGQYELKLQPEMPAKNSAGRLTEQPLVQLSTGTHVCAVMIGLEMFNVFYQDEQLCCARYRDLALAPEKVAEVSFGEILSGQLRCGFYRDTNSVTIELCNRMPGLASDYTLKGNDARMDWKVAKLTRADGQFLGIADDLTRWFVQDTGQLLALRHGLPSLYDLRPKLAKAMLSSIQIGAANVPLEDSSFFGLVQGLDPVVAFGGTLLTLSQGKVQELYSSGEQIRFLRPSLLFTTPRVLMGTDDGLCIVPVTADGRPERFARGERFFQGTFLAGGRVAAVNADDLCLFQRQRAGMVLRDRLQLRSSDVVEVLALNAETVGVLYSTGRLQRWRIA